jgi:hypothetical protein
MLIDIGDEGPELEDHPAEKQSIQMQRRKKQRTKPRKKHVLCSVLVSRIHHEKVH